MVSLMDLSVCLVEFGGCVGAIADIIERIPALFADEPSLVRRAAQAEITILLQAGDQARRADLGADCARRTGGRQA